MKKTFSPSPYAAWFWRIYTHFEGPNKSKLNWGFTQFGCSGMYLHGLQTFPCRGTLCQLPSYKNVFQEFSFHPWRQLTKHAVMKVHDQRTHCHVNMSYDGQHQKYVGTRGARSQVEIFFLIISYIKFQVQNSILIDTQSKQKFSPVKNILNAAQKINVPHSFSFPMEIMEKRINQNSCVFRLCAPCV